MVNTRAWLAEAIATFGLVFFGPLSVILAVVVFGDGSLSTEAIIMISLGHGGAIALMVYAFGHVSGAHINPAVTIPMMITKKIGVKDGIGYILFQIIGAVIATATLAVIFPEIGKQVLWGAHGGPSDIINGSVISAVVLEIIFTFFLSSCNLYDCSSQKSTKECLWCSNWWYGFLVTLSWRTINWRINESCKILFSCINFR